MIPEGEKFSAKEVVDPTNSNVVTYTYGVRRTKNGPRYEKVTVADYSECTREELISLCAYDVKVWLQGNLRNAGDSMVNNPSLWASVNIKADRINATRQPVDPEQRFIRAAAALGISEADAKAMIAMGAKIPTASDETVTEYADTEGADA